MWLFVFFRREMTFSGMTLATFITFFHLCTHQKQKSWDDEQTKYNQKFWFLRARYVKKLKWWQYLMPYGSWCNFANAEKFKDFEKEEGKKAKK